MVFNKCSLGEHKPNLVLFAFCFFSLHSFQFFSIMEDRAIFIPVNNGGVAKQEPVAAGAREGMIGLEESPLNHATGGYFDEEMGGMTAERGPQRRWRAIKSLAPLYFLYGVGVLLIISHCAIYITRKD